MANVLVIENESDQRHLMCRFLDRSGHKGVEAGNGMEGMAALVQTHFDLVICDMLMPVQDGVETIPQIRLLDPNIPIMAISGAPGVGRFSLPDDAMSLGADIALKKPFRMMKFLAAVDNVLTRSRV